MVAYAEKCMIIISFIVAALAVVGLPMMQTYMNRRVDGGTTHVVDEGMMDEFDGL